MHGIDDIGKQNGSVLIIVLWILMIVGFLAGEFLAHNRNKADLALNAMETLKRQAVVTSFFQLYTSSQWKMVTADHKASDWIGLTLNSVKFFVRVDKEGSRININKAGDLMIRNKIKEIDAAETDKGDAGLTDDDKKADELTDAILDWRDADNLVRLNGAEKEYYIDHKKPYVPANGRFKKITELLMVKGVNRTIFNGKLLKDWQKNDASDEKSSEDKVSGNQTSDQTSNKTSMDKLSLLDAFTVYPESDTRISIRIPSGKNRVYSEVLIFDKNMKQEEHIYSFQRGE